MIEREGATAPLTELLHSRNEGVGEYNITIFSYRLGTQVILNIYLKSYFVCFKNFIHLKCYKNRCGLKGKYLNRG